MVGEIKLLPHITLPLLDFTLFLPVFKPSLPIFKLFLPVFKAFGGFNSQEEELKIRSISFEKLKSKFLSSEFQFVRRIIKMKESCKSKKIEDKKIYLQVFH